ncbi:MAG: T9SS type A sorting domain-containing protein [Bacteroidota bacterium]
MKKLFMLVLLVSAITRGFSQTQIANGDFEHWYNIVVSPTLNYDEIGTGPADNWTGTLNSLASLPGTAGGPGPVTVFKSTDMHAGSYAAKAVSANFPLGSFTIFIPGMIGTAVMDMVGVKALLGKPCPDCRPSHFKGYYKFVPVNGDSCAAVILLTKWNSTSKKRDTIGYGKMVQHAAVATYTQFDITVDYRSTAIVDTMTMLVVSSAGFNVINFMGSVGQPGNTMYVDDLILEYPSGIRQVLMPEVIVNTYPNPAADLLNVDLSKEVKSASFEVYNTTGQLMSTYPASRLHNSVSVGNLVNGTYFFRLMDGKQMLNTGSFLVSK